MERAKRGLTSKEERDKRELEELLVSSEPERRTKQAKRNAKQKTIRRGATPEYLTYLLKQSYDSSPVCEPYTKTSAGRKTETCQCIYDLFHGVNLLENLQTICKTVHAYGVTANQNARFVSIHSALVPVMKGHRPFFAFKGVRELEFCPVSIGTLLLDDGPRNKFLALNFQYRQMERYKGVYVRNLIMNGIIKRCREENNPGYRVKKGEMHAHCDLGTPIENKKIQ